MASKATRKPKGTNAAKPSIPRKKRSCRSDRIHSFVLSPEDSERWKKTVEFLGDLEDYKPANTYEELACLTPEEIEDLPRLSENQAFMVELLLAPPDADSVECLWAAKFRYHAREYLTRYAINAGKLPPNFGVPELLLWMQKSGLPLTAKGQDMAVDGLTQPPRHDAGDAAAELGADADTALAEMAQRVLCVLVDKKTGPNNRLPRERIADALQEATGRDGLSGEALKYSLETLKARGLADVKTSRGGGYWATELGYRVASGIPRKQIPKQD